MTKKIENSRTKSFSSRISYRFGILKKSHEKGPDTIIKECTYFLETVNTYLYTSSDSYIRAFPHEKGNELYPNVVGKKITPGMIWVCTYLMFNCTRLTPSTKRELDRAFQYIQEGGCHFSSELVYAVTRLHMFISLLPVNSISLFINATH